MKIILEWQWRGDQNGDVGYIEKDLVGYTKFLLEAFDRGYVISTGREDGYVSIYGGKGKRDFLAMFEGE